MIAIEEGSKGGYQRSLRPSCIWRAVVAVLVMRPAVGERPEGVKTTALGLLKLARFRMLKNSARNWRVARSRKEVFLRSETSQVPRPGPIKVSRPRLP